MLFEIWYVWLVWFSTYMQKYKNSQSDGLHGRIEFTLGHFGSSIVAIICANLLNQSGCHMLYCIIKCDESLINY